MFNLKRFSSIGVIGVVMALATGALATLPISAGAAPSGPEVVLHDGVNGCEGVVATPGSQNTNKRLDPSFPSDFNPGGVVGYIIDFPVDPTDVGGRETFVITDCVFVDGTAAAKYSVSFVPNTEDFELQFSVPIPAGTPLGAELCNYAKTTAAPSASPGSNRKAGPACFTVGGGLRIEKRSGSITGDLLPGASFSVVCSPVAALPPTIITGLDPGDVDGDGTVTASGVADDGVIAIVGPSGTACTVAETASPAGYEPDLTPRHLVIPVGTSQTVEVFVNDLQRGSLTIGKTTTGGSGTFTFQVDCDGEAFDQDVTLTGTESTTITGIPTGTSCTVTEVADDLFASSVSPSNGTVIITTDGEEVLFTNTARPNGILLDKKVNGGDHATVGDALVVHAGDTLTYSVVITNDGQLPLTISTLADSLAPGFAAGCPQGIGSVLLPAASFTCTYEVTADDDANNVAGVTAVDGLDRTVGDSDSTFVDVISPAIAIVKSGPSTVEVGDSIVYTLTVTNPGDTGLAAVSVTDPKCGAAPSLDSKQGDDNVLDPGETWTFRCSLVVSAGDGSSILNTAVAAGTDVLGSTVTDTDSHTATVIEPVIDPDINVTKAADPPPVIGAEETVTVPTTTDPTTTDPTTTDPTTTDPTTTDPTTTVPEALVAGELLNPGELPRTGSSINQAVSAGLAALLFGLALSLVGRRRRAFATPQS